MDIINVIPSETVRAYINETGWDFTEWDQASILFNLDGLTLAEKIAGLRELGGRTRDGALSASIEERLQLELAAQEIFFQNSPDYFYVLDPLDDEEEPIGCFTRGESAVRLGKERGRAFYIGKYRFADAPDPAPARRKGIWNPYLFGARTQEDLEILEFGDAEPGSRRAGSARYNGRGELLRICIDEGLPFSEEKYAELLYSPRRFENRYVELPNPFQLGDIVQTAGKTGEDRRRVGVVETSQEDWARFQARVRDGRYVDFSDACITVEFPTKHGGFSHDHISPLYLERCQPEEGSPEDEILQAASSILRGKGSLGYFTYVCRKYRERKLDES